MADMPDVPDTLVIGATSDAGSPASEAPVTPAPVADNPSGAPAASATATPSTPSPSDPATPPVEPKFEIKVDGKVELLTRAEMIALAQQGKSFTQKSQKLADEQRRWEADRQAILKQEREAAIRELRAEEERKKLDAAKDPATRATERIEAMEQRLEDQQLEAVLKSLLTKHGIDEQQFLIEASKAGLRSAADVAARGEEIAAQIAESQNGRFESRFKEVLAKGEHPDIKVMKDKWLADYLAKKGSGPAPAAGLTPSLGAPPRRAKTFDEAADMAEEMLTGVAPRH